MRQRGFAHQPGEAISNDPAGTETSMIEPRIIVGGSLEEDAAAFIDAWHRAERGEHVDENVLAFESWEALITFCAAGSTWNDS